MTTKKKVAVVTGASKGIGKAVAIGLARSGYETVLIARDKKALDEAALEIKQISGSRPVSFKLDITHTESIKTAVSQIVDELKTIDVLVNNAGMHFKGSLSVSEENFRKMLDTNLTAQFVFLQEVVPVMKKQCSGYIFNIASRAGKIGFTEGGAYAASKFGLVGLNESLYRELTPQGIKVTALCPAWVNTTMAFEAGVQAQPDEIIQPDDIFKTIQWLLNLSGGACVKDVVIATPVSV